MQHSTECTAAAWIQRHAHKKKKYVCPYFTPLFNINVHPFLSRAEKQGGVWFVGSGRKDTEELKQAAKQQNADDGLGEKRKMSDVLQT